PVTTDGDAGHVHQLAAGRRRLTATSSQSVGGSNGSRRSDGGQHQHRSVLKGSPASGFVADQEALSGNRPVIARGSGARVVLARPQRQVGGWHRTVDAGHGGQSGTLPPAVEPNGRRGFSP